MPVTWRTFECGCPGRMGKCVPVAFLPHSPKGSGSGNVQDLRSDERDGSGFHSFCSDFPRNVFLGTHHRSKPRSQSLEVSSPGPGGGRRGTSKDLGALEDPGPHHGAGGTYRSLWGWNSACRHRPAERQLPAGAARACRGHQHGGQGSAYPPERSTRMGHKLGHSKSQDSVALPGLRRNERLPSRQTACLSRQLPLRSVHKSYAPLREGPRDTGRHFHAIPSSGLTSLPFV